MTILPDKAGRRAQERVQEPMRLVVEICPTVQAIQAAQAVQEAAVQAVPLAVQARQVLAVDG